MKQITIYLVPSAVIGALLLLFIWDIGPGPCLAAYALKTTCSDIEKRYDDILSSASGTCRSNADCGCYGPVSIKSGCGGVTDKKSADRLRDLVQEFRKTGCDWHVQCGAWLCNPVCAQGSCVRGINRNLQR